MERKFLKELGVSDEAIEKIMAENGKDVEAVKGQRDDYKQKYEDTQKTLKGFEGVDVKDLQGKITQLTNDLTAKDKEYDEKDFLRTLAQGAKDAKAKNHDAVIAVLGKEKVEALKSSKNRDKDIEAAFKALKEDKNNAYLFDAVSAPKVVSSTPGASKVADDAKSKANEGIRSFFGKGEGE